MNHFEEPIRETKLRMSVIPTRPALTSSNASFILSSIESNGCVLISNGSSDVLFETMLKDDRLSFQMFGECRLIGDLANV